MQAGDSGAPVVGALVIVGATRFTSDLTGTVVVEGVLALGAPIQVEHAGYLTRRTRAEDPVPVLTLWPKSTDAGNIERLSGELVYTDSNRPPLHGAAMRRVRHGAVMLDLSAELRADAASVQAHERAASLITSATDGQVVFSLGGCGGGTCVRVTSGTTTAQGEARVSLDADGYVASGEIRYPDLTLARRFDVALHEMGHIYGLHHGSGNVIMCGGVGGTGQCQGPLPIAALGQFTPAERAIMKLMLLRRAGNRFPDDEGLSGTGLLSVTACRF